MTSLYALVTALVRLLGLFFFVKALESAVSPLFYIISMQVAMPPDTGFQAPNPWGLFLPMVAIYLVLTAGIFFAAPRIARIVIPRETSDTAEVHWHETLLFCTGVLILSWAFVRITDTVYNLVRSSANNDGQYSLDDAMLVYLFMTALLVGGGFLLIAKYHRIGKWMATRRAKAATQDTGN